MLLLKHLIPYLLNDVKPFFTLPAIPRPRRGGLAIDGRTTRHLGYEISQRIRKRVEEIGGWIKSIGGFRRTRFKEERRTQLAAWFVGTAYNLLRMAKLKSLEVEA